MDDPCRLVAPLIAILRPIAPLPAAAFGWLRCGSRVDDERHWWFS